MLRRLWMAWAGLGCLTLCPLSALARDEPARKGAGEARVPAVAPVTYVLDHWDEYREFDLGPRPEADPATWMQVDANGKMCRHYKYEGDYYPPYKPHHRYAACLNNPYSNAWLAKVAQWCARCGYDGVFVDNAGGQRCYCDACQAGFRDWAASRYSPEEIQRRFHVGRADEVRLAVGRREIDLPWVETKRFWVETARRQQALIRAAGEAVVGKGKFYVFPNGANNSPHWVRDAFADCDWVMSENSGSYIGAYGTHPGADRSGHGPCAPPGEDGRRGRDAVRTGQGAKEGAVGGRRRIRHDPRPELLDLHGVPRVRHLAKKKPPAAFPEREERGSGAGGRGRGAKGGGGRPR